MAFLYEKKHKKWQSVLSVLLVFCLIAAPLSFGGGVVRAAENRVFDIGVNPDSVKAELSPDGRLSISGVGDTKDFTPETAPFAALPVTSLEIGGGVTSLGAYLFYGCGSLSGELVLPGSLTAIGTGAFSGGSKDSAPGFSLIRNAFTQCTLTEKKTASVSEEGGSLTFSEQESQGEASGSEQASSADGAEASGAEAPEEGKAAAQVESTAEVSQSPALAESSSAPENTKSEETGESAAGTEDAESTASTVSGSENSSAQQEASQPEESGKQYQLETVTDQRMGEDVFYPGSGEGKLFTCSDENLSFREAAEQAGYQRAERLTSAAFDCGEGQGGTVVKELPVASGNIVLPKLPAEFSAPEGGELFSYAFGGWTESLDAADVVRQPGTVFQAGDREDLYFIASWNREVLVKLAASVKDGVLTLTVPEIEGYDVTFYRWQVCELENEQGTDEEALPWEDISGDLGASYSRALEPEDENRAFRCVLTVKRKGFFALFSRDSGEEIPLDAVNGAQFYAAGTYAITCEKGSYENGAVPTGSDPEPIAVTEGDYGVIPACTYTAPAVSGSVIVFNGWLGSDGKTYDPGQIVPLTEDLVLTAQWGAATIRYVDGANGGRTNGGTSSSDACQWFKKRGTLYVYNGAYEDLPESGTKYTNIVVVCGNTTVGTGNYALDSKNATITSLDPSDGTQYNATLTVNNDVALSADTIFRDITISGGDHNLLAGGHRLCMGDNVTTGAYSLNLYGGVQNGSAAFGENSGVLAASGSYLAVFGGNYSGNTTGNTSVHFSGTAKAGVVFGASWSGGSVLTGNTEVLFSGNAQAASISGGNRAPDDSAGVTGRAHVMVGGNARVEDTDGIQNNSAVAFQSIGFVSGSGADASASQPSIGNVRGGTLVEIRENAYVQGSVFGGSGDGWASDPNASHPDWVGTQGGMEVRVTGSASIGGSVYGGGNKRACEGDSTVLVEGGSIAGSVFGGASRGNSTGSSSIVISGGVVSGSVYGGGDQGDLTGSGVVTVSGGTVSGSVYGGGKNGTVSGGTSATVSGGAVSGSVYGGGEEGSVGQNSFALLSGGTVEKSVFGGGKGVASSSETGKVQGDSKAQVTGGSLGVPNETGSPAAGVGNLFGGGEYAATAGGACALIGASGESGSSAFSITGSVYGGGSLAPAGTSSVEMWSGQVQGSVYGAGLGAASSTAGQASVTINGGTVENFVYGGGEMGAANGGTQVALNGGEIVRDLFGGGCGDKENGDESAGRVLGPAVVTVGGGKVRNLYGGGDYGPVGSGTLSGTGSGLTVTASDSSSSTSVSVAGGSVTGSVFGGGSGSGSEDTLGAVFGPTTVSITAGQIGSNVYGGSNRSYVSGRATVSVKASDGPVSIGGTVFGGGNLPGGEGAQFQEIYLVQGGASVEIDGGGGNDLSIEGSVYGSGNLTLVNGGRPRVAIRDFNGSLQSLQRAERADIINSSLYLVGAVDVTEEVNQRYSISQIDDLRLVDGSLLRVDREVRALESIGSYTTSGDDSVPTSEEASRSTLRVYQGKKLLIRSMDGAYGPIRGVLWLDIVPEEGVQTDEMGISIQASADSDWGDGSTDTGAFVKAASGGGADLPLVSGLIEGSHTYWRLGSAVDRIDQTIRATHGDNGGTGLVEQSFSVTTSAQKTMFVLTERKQTGSFFLVKPVEGEDGSMSLPSFSEGQTAGNTFALRVDTASSETVWEKTGGGLYVLTSDESQNGGGPGVWKLTTDFPTTASSGGEGEVTFQLLYDPSYERFTGGEVELTFQEYPVGAEMTPENVESTTVVTLTLEGDDSRTAREAYGAAGRKFAEISGTEPVSITNSGSMTAYFVTQYSPVTAGAQDMSLSLYRKEGETAALSALPEGTKIVLADFSTSESRYYMFHSDGGSSLALSGFADMGKSGSFYSGPNNTGQITEKLLFTVDFSEAAQKLSAGEYQLRLAHSPTESAMQTVDLVIASTEKPTLGVVPSKTGDWWTLKATFTPAIPEDDTRFADGALVKLTLTDDAEGVLGFSGRTKFGGVENLLRGADGSVSFSVSKTGDTQVTIDFSEVPAEMLPTNVYGLKAELRPRTGLQVSTDGGEADASSWVTFTLQRKTIPQRAIQVELTSGDRVMDVSEAQGKLTLSISAQAESGDRLKAVIYRKVGETPEPSSYLETSAAWCQLSSLSSGKATAALTVPKGTEAGTYRIVFQILDTNGGVTSETPYNFIVK